MRNSEIPLLLHAAEESITVHSNMFKLESHASGPWYFNWIIYINNCSQLHINIKELYWFALKFTEKDSRKKDEYSK